jgi:hypothetical protein
MRLLKDNLSIKYPNYLFLTSCSNENDTEGDIDKMGTNLAEEVRRFIKEWCPNF